MISRRWNTTTRVDNVMNGSYWLYFFDRHVINVIQKLETKVEGQGASSSDATIDGGSVNSGQKLHEGAIFRPFMEGKGDVNVDVVSKRI